MKSFEQLMEEWEAGTLSAEDLQELKRLLAATEARAELVGDWLFHEAIYDALRSRPAEAPAPALAPAEVRAPLAQPASQSRGPSPRRSRWLVWREARISWRSFIGFAAAACLTLAGLHFYFQRAAVGHLSELRAQVFVEHAGRKLAATEGQLLYPGDLVQVSVAGAATVAWTDEATRLELAANTELQLLDPMRGKRFLLRAGLLQANVGPQFGWRPMTIFTPQAEAKVVGTVFSLSVSNVATRLEVLEGAVRLRKSHLSSIDDVSEIMVQSGEVAEATAARKLEIQFLTGFLSSDIWTVPPGTAFANAATRGKLLTPSQQAAADPDAANNVERLRGYLLAPATGDYTFWIASFKGEVPAELWLSTDADPAHKRLVGRAAPPQAGQPSGGRSGQRPGLSSALDADWQRDPSQRSAPQKMVQGRRYYVEVWHEGAGTRSLAIGWRIPGEPESAQPKMVDLDALCPFIEKSGAHARAGSTAKD